MNATLSSHEAAREAAHQAARYELRFQCLADAGRAFSFPCDEEGHVDIDSLGTKARLNYFYARTLIGREVSLPAVQCCTLQ